MMQGPPPSTNVPDLVRIGMIPTNQFINIETDVLDPVIHSDTFCRFQFQNKGILHSHSKIVLRMATDANEAFFPLNIGVHSLIQRCALRVGTKTICEIDDFNHYVGYKSIFLSNENQKYREQYVSGRMIAHKPYYNDGVANGSGSSQTEAPKVGIDIGVAPKATASQVMETVGNVSLRTFQKVNSAYGQEFQVALSDLFPFLYTNQLPLYMMREPVTVELTFSPALRERLVAPSNLGDSYTIDTTATQLIADYQYFPNELMQQYAVQNNDLSMTYMDYRLSKRTITITSASGANAASGEKIINVGGAGRIATKVITMLSRQNQKDNALLNNYHAFGCDRTYGTSSSVDTNGTLTSNLKYNDNLLYPVDITNPAVQFHNVVQSEGMVPFVTREEYSFQGDTTTAVSVEAIAQNDNTHGDTATAQQGLVNQFFYQAYKLNRNERTNQRGIEIIVNYNPLKNLGDGATDNYTLRSYVELVKVARLNNGLLESFYA
jgi:hypothetical protein